MEWLHSNKRRLEVVVTQTDGELHPDEPRFYAVAYKNGRGRSIYKGAGAGETETAALVDLFRDVVNLDLVERCMADSPTGHHSDATKCDELWNPIE